MIFMVFMLFLYHCDIYDVYIGARVPGHQKLQTVG